MADAMHPDVARMPVVVRHAAMGGLFTGVARALGFRRVRPVLYVEAEALFVALLAAKMAVGELPEAPVWADLRRLPDASVEALLGVAERQPVGFCDRLPSGRNDSGFDREGQPLGWTATRTALRRLRPEFVVLAGGPGPPAVRLPMVIEALAEGGLHGSWDVFCPSSLGASVQAPNTFVVGASDRVLDDCGAAVDATTTDRRRVDDGGGSVVTCWPPRTVNSDRSDYPPAPGDVDAWRDLATAGVNPVVDAEMAARSPFPALAPWVGCTRDDWFWMLRSAVDPQLAAVAITQLLATLIDRRAHVEALSRRA